MQISAPKNKKTSDSLGDLHVNDWKDKKKRIGTSTLHLVSHYLQRSDWGPARLRKQN